MKVVSVTPTEAEIVEVESGDWTIFRRGGPDSWECLMGESWEPVYDTGELEAAYQAFKRG